MMLQPNFFIFCETSLEARKSRNFILNIKYNFVDISNSHTKMFFFPTAQSKSCLISPQRTPGERTSDEFRLPHNFPSWKRRERGRSVSWASDEVVQLRVTLMHCVCVCVCVCVYDLQCKFCTLCVCVCQMCVCVCVSNVCVWQAEMSSDVCATSSQTLRVSVCRMSLHVCFITVSVFAHFYHRSKQQGHVWLVGQRRQHGTQWWGKISSEAIIMVFFAELANCALLRQICARRVWCVCVWCCCAVESV